MSAHKFWVSVSVVVVVLFALVFAGIWYTNHEITKANQEWCELLTSLDSPVPPSSTPSNPNPRAIDIAMKLHNLRIRFGC